MNIFKHILIAFLCICIFNSCNTEESKVINQVAAIPVLSLSPDGVHTFTADTSFGVAGDVYMDKEVEGHVRISEGKGILYNQPGRDTNTYAQTKNEHGDLYMQVEFMVSKGSSAALYLQGRYGIQLSDSRNKGNSLLQCGAIFQHGRTKAGPLMTMPVSDAAKVPGLWQRLAINFTAPRFDRSGNKLSDAVFKEVVLNGQLIHTNIPVTNTALDTAFRLERTAGPLLFRSHYGAVAFRNLTYTAQSHPAIVLSDMRYDVYKELSGRYDMLKNYTPERTGSTDSLSWRLEERKKQLVIAGNMNVAEDGDYVFKVKAGGPVYIFVDSSEVVNNHQLKNYTSPYFGNRYLQKGMHSFQVVYTNYNDGLMLEYEGPVTSFTALTTPSSARKPEDIGLIKTVKNKKLVFQKGLFRHNRKVISDILSVSLPGGLNYAYDQRTCNVLSVWRGNAVPDIRRDSGSPGMQVPSGAPVELKNRHALFSLAKPDGPWPATLQINDSIYTDKTYRLDTMGLPVFLYRYLNMNIEDYMYSGEKNTLIRQISLQAGSAAEPVYFMIGSGSIIERLPNGLYAIDDKTFYVQILNAGDEKNVSITKDDAGRYRLLMLLSPPGNDVPFSYSIIW